MIARDAVPVDHVSPYKRIEIGAPSRTPETAATETEGGIAKALRDGEAERIWRHVVQVARGGAAGEGPAS